jgi:hypothetical protein
MTGSLSGYARCNTTEDHLPDPPSNIGDINAAEEGEAMQRFSSELAERGLQPVSHECLDWVVCRVVASQQANQQGVSAILPDTSCDGSASVH